MKRGLHLGLVGAAALIGGVEIVVLASTPSDALIVECANCSTEVQQVLAFGKQLEELAQEIQTAQNTLMFYLNAVRQAEMLPETIYRDLTFDVAAISSIARPASMFGGYSGRMLTNLSVPGGYPLAGAADFTHQIAMETQAIAFAMQQAQTAINAHSQQQQTQSASLASLEQQARGTDSRNQILQSIAGIQATNGQMQATQGAATAAMTQAMLTAEVARADREAYTVSVTTAQERAGVQAACTAAGSTGVGIAIPACSAPVPQPVVGG